MSATRTQIYLTEEQRRRIDLAAKSAGLSMAEVIRRALDEYLGDDVAAKSTLQVTFGSIPDASAPSRDDWHRG